MAESVEMVLREHQLSDTMGEDGGLAHEDGQSDGFGLGKKDSTQQGLSEEEFARAAQLVGNGHRFSLEAPSSVAASAGSQTLWGRRRELLAPAEDVQHWDASTLSAGMMPLLQPERGFTLIARPEEVA